MNELIRELADQAYSYAGEQIGEFTPEFMGFYDEKFAELIVKECNEVLRLVPYNSNVEFGDEVIYQDAIKKHFGVELCLK